MPAYHRSLRPFRAGCDLAPGLKFVAACLVAGGLVHRAHALTIVPTFDSSFSGAQNSTQAENAVQTAINAIDSLYSTAGTIPVLFKYDASLGGGAASSNVVLSTSYNTWRAELSTISTANSSDTVLSTALASLPAAGSVSQSIQYGAAYDNMIMGDSLFLAFDSTGTFHGSGGQTYASVVTVSEPGTLGNFYTASTGFTSTAVSAAEHEIDEVLSGGGAGTSLESNSTGTPTQYGTLDLYRYLSGNGTDGSGTLGARSWSASTSILTYFSINGGASAVVDQNGNPIGFNQSGSGDYGDFATTSGIGRIQDWQQSSNAAPDYTSSSPEATMMQAIGYTTTPEPTALTLLGGAFAGLALFRRRRVS